MSSKKTEAKTTQPQWAILASTTLLAVCVGLAFAVMAYPRLYADRVYPGISVQEVDLGGLSVDEATAVLTAKLSTPSVPIIELEGSDHYWQLGWDDVGRRYDEAATAQLAYGVARREPWYKEGFSAWRIRFEGRSLEPQVVPTDPARISQFLDQIAPQVYVPPIDAELNIRPDQVSCSSGRQGRALDIEATAKRVIDAIQTGLSDVEPVTGELPPTVNETEPACTRAKNLLSEPFTLVASDPLTNFYTEFKAPSQEIARWLDTKTAGDSVLLEINRTAVDAWILETASQIGEARMLDEVETLNRTLAALRAGEHRAQCAIKHPEKTYVVESGDTLFNIAFEHGFPQWRLEEANPDVEPNELLIGMELTIPSIDVLFPEPLVLGKRIEINLPEQQLIAYEGEEAVYEFTVSSGMTKTPTISGQFQVLFKEPDAYAQRWNLEMPYFIAIYYERPGFANGIHELPIRADGQRLWASVLGWPASYGCIILNVGDAEKLYSWAPVGTLVRIRGVAPGTPLYVPTYDEQASEQ